MIGGVRMTEGILYPAFNIQTFVMYFINGVLHCLQYYTTRSLYTMYMYSNIIL